MSEKCILCAFICFVRGIGDLYGRAGDSVCIRESWHRCYLQSYCSGWVSIKYRASTYELKNNNPKETHRLLLVLSP